MCSETKMETHQNAVVPSSCAALRLGDRYLGWWIMDSMPLDTLLPRPATGLRRSKPCKDPEIKKKKHQGKTTRK